MQATDIPILLTSSVIVYDQDVLLKDKSERIRFAIESVAEWLKIDPGLSLVLCDGSGFDFSELVAKKFPCARIECLVFENDQIMVEKFGRGYGEGEIIRYAIQHSKFIAKADCFTKCSSKLWVKNYSKCIERWNNRALFKGVFFHSFSPFRPTELSYIDTRFYIVNTSFYHQYFENAHKHIGQKFGHGLEDSFLDVFTKEKICQSLIDVAPVICGVGGGIGTHYKNSTIRILKEKFRMVLNKKNPAFQHLFI
jgi:hypothetical protein